ncbi:hypothetical protein F4553_001355 [Allocatelliglobosispora scoriae]|uniref:Uncharacterized protein n=1 Tax=Allocatelliglobosispora scoriae TaxID=643052 RepID=A0A841BL56_9ACTN|nr:hypothetical protein [Allocatelliglobosispora scoriae]
MPYLPLGNFSMDISSHVHARMARLIYPCNWGDHQRIPAAHTPLTGLPVHVSAEIRPPRGGGSRAGPPMNFSGPNVAVTLPAP